MQFSQLLGNLHLRLVPFPIVLLLAALLLDAAGLLWRSERAHWTGKLLMLAGTVTLLLAFICGISAEIWAGRAGVPLDQIELHEVAATIASWGFIGLMAWRLFLDRTRRRAMIAYVIVGLALYAQLALTGWLGGKLVTDYGAAVAGGEAKTIASLHDLNTLAQRQTDWNLRYSDIMHHSAGAFVLALTFAIFVRELWPQHAHRVRWVGPALLVAGGVLLFFFADLDLYALRDPRQFLDREAQAHKLIAIILAAVGVRMLLKQRRIQSAAAPSQYQNRLIAVLALVGGALLFTHVHSVAPYANVAAGVYINHIVMGFVALTIGGAKLFEDALPNRTRVRSLIFPALMLVESFLLLTYTEGIPWWAGIGHYNRWGPNGGSIAPFGKERAELAFNPDTGQMDVRVLERFKNEPVRVATTNISVVVWQRYDQTSVSLGAVDADAMGTATHFRGQADFLKHALQFDARITLPLRGRVCASYIDPWVIPAVTGVPPNKVARFGCPMHEGIRETAPGVCPLCGMPLAPIQTKPTTALHDPKYAMTLARDGNRLTFTPQLTATGKTVTDLMVVHEHLLHLIIVSDDLVFFDHVHPTRQSDGSFVIDYNFPRPDNYILFADITPTGERAQVFRISLDPLTKSNPPLSVAPALAREVGAYHVELIQQPRALVAQRESHLAFRLTRDGKPVTDLQPYIGAMGHCVVISEDTQLYLHSHPKQFTAAPPPDARGGPEVSFHTTFPRPGRYKVWGQFKRGDEIIVADFVVNVERPLLPQWLARVLIYD